MHYLFSLLFAMSMSGIDGYGFKGNQSLTVLEEVDGTRVRRCDVFMNVQYDIARIR